MRVLFISSQFPNSLQPDLGIFSLQIARNMASETEIKVIAPIPTWGVFNFANHLKRYQTELTVPEVETIDGLTVFHPKYFAFPAMGFTHHLSLLAALAPLIKKIHEEWPVDAINCHWLFPDGVAVQRIGYTLGIPVMLTALGCDLNRYTKWISRKYAIRAALTHAEMVSVLNDDMVGKCGNLGVTRQKLVKIPNGVDLDAFHICDQREARKHLDIPTSGRVILFVGSLVEVKNVHRLIKAFRSVRAGYAHCTLVLVGSGHFENDLKRLAQKSGIRESVRFAGQIGHDLLVEWLNAADCLCLPSLREGHPNVMMEALACGIPVVATAVGSVPDFIDDSTGCLIGNPLDGEEIAEKLGLCLSRNYDRGAIRKSVEGYSWRRCAGRYLEALDGIVA